MSLGNNTGSSVPLHEQQNNDADIIYDFSKLRDELDDGSSVEDDQDEVIVFEDADDDTLEYEFATDTEILTSATFEEEAFGVKSTGNPINRGTNRQDKPSIWTKDPFAPKKFNDSGLSKGDNLLKKMAYRSKAPPPSNREISAGLSFASILSGNASRVMDSTGINSEGNTHIENPQPNDPPATLPDKDQAQPSGATVQGQEINGQSQDATTENHHPIVYSLTDVEAKIGQPQAPKKNLLYQLLPGLAPPPQTPVNHAPVDINSFFEKHQSKQQQHTRHMPSIHKPNLTAEQELKQKEEDNGKSSYDGLMTANNKKFINHIEQSQLATSTQQSSGDYYHEMYRANNNGGHYQQPLVNHQLPPVNINNMDYQQNQHIYAEKDKCAELDTILSDIMKNQLGAKGDSEKDTTEDELHQKDNKEQHRPKNDRQLLLKTIESMYFLILEVEQLSRQMQLSGTTTRQETMDKIWGMLTTDQSPPAVISILSVNKGMSLIARLLPHLEDHKRSILMTSIAYHFVDLLPPLNTNDGNISTYQQQQRQNVDYLHPSITGCLENTLFCASLSYIGQVLSSVSNHPDYKNLIGTVTGHRFVGSLLFHARGKQQQQVTDTDNEQWRAGFDSFFNNTMVLSPLIKDMAHVENMGLWMLLNSMAACCNEQQKESMGNDYREPLLVAMKTLTDMTRTHPLPYLPYHLQATFPIVNELWATLGLADKSGET
ncbi:topoisomerase II-associated protein PAT1-domain-containing protein [Chlamydoabsidia padenii]|nr:topoisomerase II-associated protein PAT1-domain-containing protein [Chlamydoabsidia padenii]